MAEKRKAAGAWELLLTFLSHKDHLAKQDEELTLVDAGILGKTAGFTKSRIKIVLNLGEGRFEPGKILAGLAACHVLGGFDIGTRLYMLELCNAVFAAGVQAQLFKKGIIVDNFRLCLHLVGSAS